MVVSDGYDRTQDHSSYLDVKTSSTELSEAIGPMFNRDAIAKVYLENADDGDDPRYEDLDFPCAGWYSCRWTIQEFITLGPPFPSRSGTKYGSHVPPFVINVENLIREWNF